MNLKNLKPAWRQFVLFNSLQPVDPNEVLLIIDAAEFQTTGRLPRFLLNTMMFIILTICSGG